MSESGKKLPPNFAFLIVIKANERIQAAHTECTTLSHRRRKENDENKIEYDVLELENEKMKTGFGRKEEFEERRKNVEDRKEKV